MNPLVVHRSSSVGFAAAVAAACIATTLIGCGSTPKVARKSVGQTSEVVHTPVFVAPDDPDMEPIAVVVGPVMVSAPFVPGTGDIGTYIRSQFNSALATSKDFIVSNPDAFDEIARQASLADAGVTRPEDHPRFGEVVGARYIINVSLTELQQSVVGEAKKDKVEAGGILSLVGVFIDGTIGAIVRGIGAGNPSVSNELVTMRGVVGIEVQVTDVTSATIVAVSRAQAQLETENQASSAGFAGVETREGNFQQTVVAQATRAAVEDAVLKVHEALRTNVRVASSREVPPDEVPASSHSVPSGPIAQRR